MLRHHEQVFKGQSSVKWAFAPLESLYDVDAIIRNWEELGTKVELIAHLRLQPCFAVLSADGAAGYAVLHRQRCTLNWGSAVSPLRLCCRVSHADRNCLQTLKHPGRIAAQSASNTAHDTLNPIAGAPHAAHSAHAGPQPAADRVPDVRSDAAGAGGLKIQSFGIMLIRIWRLQMPSASGAMLKGTAA